jgi:hypothetical protein
MKTTLAVLLLTALLLAPSGVRAHCDTMDGPVIMDAKVALEKSDVAPVLKWVNKDGEAEIRAAFTKTLAVRKQGADAKELADRYFFETLVRVHRAGEGAPYTGLKPAGTVEPPVAAADKALETGKVDELVKELTGAVAEGVRQRFARAAEAKKHAEHNVAAGRGYVAAYIEFVHYVEQLHTAAGKVATEHHHEH